VVTISRLPVRRRACGVPVKDLDAVDMPTVMPKRCIGVEQVSVTILAAGEYEISAIDLVQNQNATTPEISVVFLDPFDIVPP